MINQALFPKLRQFRLSGIAYTLDARAVQAEQSHLTYVEFLLLIVDDELERREQKRISQRLKKSCCEPEKSIEHFDFSANGSISRSQITDLCSCSYIVRHENVLICGPTGVGKTHLANALGIEALKQDFKVISKTAYRLLLELTAARADESYDKLFAEIVKCDC